MTYKAVREREFRRKDHFKAPIPDDRIKRKKKEKKSRREKSDTFPVGTKRPLKTRMLELQNENHPTKKHTAMNILLSP